LPGVELGVGAEVGGWVAVATSGAVADGLGAVVGTASSEGPQAATVKIANKIINEIRLIFPSFPKLAFS
jgi:hypothetical protein